MACRTVALHLTTLDKPESTLHPERWPYNAVQSAAGYKSATARQLAYITSLSTGREKTLREILESIADGENIPPESVTVEYLKSSQASYVISCLLGKVEMIPPTT